MGYKIIDGKLCLVEEVDVNQLKIEVDQALKVVAETEGKKVQLEAQKKNVANEYDNQIAIYRKQIASIETTISGLEERKLKATNPYDVEISNADLKIQDLKARLEDKKEAIAAVLPDAYTKLGF